MSKVNVIYHHFPHYRRPVMRELVKSGVHEYRFWGSLDAISGIKAFQGDDLVSIRPIRFRFRGSTWVLKDYWPAVLDRSADVLVVHGHPNMPASWLIGLVGRLTGKKVLYWAHGWLKREPPFRAFIRRLHYSLGHRVMTYGERARKVAAQTGFPPEKIVPIYNSLDWLVAREVLQGLQAEGVASIRQRLGIPQDVFLISCVARLTSLCRFDLLLDAIAQLKQRGTKAQAILIGDGPVRAKLEEQAARLDVDVQFLGAIYDEEILGAHIFASDVTASPGKIGLSAMHSLMYGTPVVSHDDMDSQMPEIEAIVPGKSGLLFKRNDVASLADALESWCRRSADREAMRKQCLEIIETRYNPVAQAKIINDTISQVVGK